MTAPPRTVVKVCGLTRAEDAAWALECGADWLGFIVAAWGPRQVGADGMAAILAELPAGTVGVAIVADRGPEEALALARRAGASRLQLYHADPAAWPADFPLPCAFVSSVDETGAVTGPIAPRPHLVHLDTARGSRTGGTGSTFPWERARKLCGDLPFMLAGGLDADNVAAALAATAPFGVDAASRLESAPGIKDRDKVRRFVAAVREFDERHADPA